jgi:REP element-mobilizing transposase RayT
MMDDPPPGFRGLHPDVPVTIRHRHLPHWRQAGATYFVTFRLADSLPAQRLAQLRSEYESWKRRHADPTEKEYEAFVKERMQRVEKWLDAGHGECLLRSRRLRYAVERCLARFDGGRYLLGAFAVVPNHVHAVVRPTGDWQLETVAGAWKQYSALAINKACGKNGALWQEESFDRIVRDTPHLRRVVAYIEENIEEARGQGTFWIRSDWIEWFYGKEAGLIARPTEREADGRPGGSPGPRRGKTESPA